MIIGLTGGIASGKSTAARYLSENGAFVMDGDVLGHRAYEPNTAAFAQIAETFGSEVVRADGQIDRKALGGKVFGNPNALKQLTDILYPEIRRMFSEWIETTQADNPNALLVMDAAVLLEAGWENLADETWVVIVDPETAVDRAVVDQRLQRHEAAADVVVGAKLRLLVAQLDLHLVVLVPQLQHQHRRAVERVEHELVAEGDAVARLLEGGDVLDASYDALCQ